MNTLDELAAREPSIDDLWATVHESMEVAEAHKLAIYRGEGVEPLDAVAGLEKHMAAGLAARVLYDRASALASRLAALERVAEAARRVSDEIGIHPAASPGHTWTKWEEGWNAGVDAALRPIEEAVEALDELEAAG